MELSTLRYGRTSFADAQPILRNWNATVVPDQSCAQGICSARISLGDFVYRHAVFFSHHQHLFWAYGILGGRPAAISAGVSFRDGVLHSKSYFVGIEVFPHESAAFGFTAIGYSLLAETEIADALPLRRRNTSIRSQHPTYEVGSPGGCEVCISIWAHFSGSASAADVARIGAIDSSCLSRWFRPCRLKADIMPAAWRIQESESPYARPD
jgi:hypothetical protein